MLTSFMNRVYPVGCESDINVFEITGVIAACPAGFSLQREVCTCNETLLRYTESLECNVQTRLVKNTGNMWIPSDLEDQRFHGILWYSSCPYGYCRHRNKTHPALLNFTSPNSSNTQCVAHRYGTLCRACEEGFSLALYSRACVHCGNYFLSLTAVFAAAGLGLIVLLLSLQMTVASGTIYGLILYANIVNAHSYLFLPCKEREYSMNLLSVFISWVSLDFGIPVCFCNGLDAYQYLSGSMMVWMRINTGLDVYQYSGLQYVFPLYLWFLTGAIIFVSHWSSRLGRLLGSNPIAVLATVLFMSYVKLLETAIDAFSFADLDSSDGSGRTVWWYDRTMDYFKGRHTIMAAASIAIIFIVLIPYILFLSLGHWFHAYSDRKGFQWFNKITLFLDAYYALFKRASRYWPGLLLWVRVGLYCSVNLRDDLMVVIFCNGNHIDCGMSI